MHGLRPRGTTPAHHSAAGCETASETKRETDRLSGNSSSSKVPQSRSTHPTCSARPRHCGRSGPRAGDWRARHHARPDRHHELLHRAPRPGARVAAVIKATSARRPILRAESRGATAVPEAAAEGSVWRILAARRARLRCRTMRRMHCALGHLCVSALFRARVSSAFWGRRSLDRLVKHAAKLLFLACVSVILLILLVPRTQPCSYHCSICDERPHGRGADHRGRSGRARIAAQRPAQTEGDGQTGRMIGISTRSFGCHSIRARDWPHFNVSLSCLLVLSCVSVVAPFLLLLIFFFLS